MSFKKYEKINHKTGDKVTTYVTKHGNSTNVQRELHKSDGVLGTRFLGTKKLLSNKTTKRSK